MAEPRPVGLETSFQALSTIHCPGGFLPLASSLISFSFPTSFREISSPHPTVSTLPVSSMLLGVGVGGWGESWSLLNLAFPIWERFLLSFIWLSGFPVFLLGIFYLDHLYFIYPVVAQTVKHPPAVWETQVRSLGWEDPLEKEMPTHSRTLAWKIPWTEEPGRLQSMGLQRVGHDWATSFSLSYFICVVKICDPFHFSFFHIFLSRKQS